MKKIVLLFLILNANGIAQEKYITKTGNVNFEASVPSFEEVKATNESTTAIINTDNGEFAALVLIKGFRFKNALMEEHFNENYAESSKYPKATFNGKITDFKQNKLGIYIINGELIFHGVAQTLENISININYKDDVILISGEFISNASDFEIDIPKIVKNKIAHDVKVTFFFEMKKK